MKSRYPEFSAVLILFFRRSLRSSRPAHRVRRPKHAIKSARPRCLSARQHRRLRLCRGSRTGVPIVVHLRFARMGAIVAMRVENCHPRGKPWWIRLEETGGKSHECRRVTFRSVSLRLHRGRRNPQRRPAPFWAPPARRPNAERQCRRLAHDPARCRQYRLARPGRSESTPPTAQANIQALISAPR